MNPPLAFGVPSAESMIESLGWALVHSLWQFAVVALIAGIAVRALRRYSAELRYWVLVAAMGVASIAPVVTWILLPSGEHDDFPRPTRALQFDSHLELATNRSADTRPLDSLPNVVSVPGLEEPKRDVAASDSTSEMRPVDNAAALSWTERAVALLRPWLAGIVAGWSFGVAFCSLRPLVGWRTIWRLQRVGIAPVSDDVLSAMQRVAARLGIRNAVRVAQSMLAQVPVVVGYTRPMILLPVSLLTNLPVAQLEAILAHELAHVRRHDFLVNVLQALVETVFFYHPAVWWLSHRIRIEREHCCDDLVVMRLGNPVDYGRALVAIEELRGRGVLLALGAADGSLLSRVRRLAGASTDSAVRSSWSAASLVACCTGALLGLGILGWYGMAETRGDRSPAEVEGSVEPNLEPGGARLPEFDDENAVATVELVFFQDRSRRALPAIVTTSDGETLAVTAGPATVVPDGTPHAIDRAFLTIAGKPPIEVIYDKRRSNTEFCVYRIAGELTSYRLKAPVHVAVGDSLSAIIRNGAGGWRVVPKSATVTGFDRKAELRPADYRIHHKFANLIEVDRKLPEGTPLFKDGRLVGLTLLGSRFVGGQAERSYVVPADRILAVAEGEGVRDHRNDDASGKPAREAPADSLIPDGEESNSSDNRRDPGSKSETLTAESVPKLSGEWILGEFGLEYRVRSETTSLVAGEMPLLFVEVRNRGSLEDMAVEGHQSRHAVVVDGTRYVRNDQPWGGVDVLAPGGKSVTLPFALSNDWKGEAETKAPLQFPPGKHRIVVSLVIAPYSPPPTADDTTVPPRRVQWRTLVTRPIDVEFRSGAWAGPPDSLGVENIRRELFAIPHFHSPTVPLNLRRLVHEHQPLAGDYLVKLLNSDDSTFHEAAAVVFGATWDSMNRAQIEHDLHATMTHFVGLRPKYPQRIDAMIGMGTRHRPGYLGLPTDRKYEVKTVTTHYLDGRQIEKPFSYPGLGAQTHWIRTKDLPLGTHTFRLATAYTFTRGSETYRGSYTSPEFTFEIVPTETPDDLVAPKDEELDRLVRDALRIAETEEELQRRGDENYRYFDKVPSPDSDSWRPQVTWGRNEFGISGLHTPVWRIVKRLPVDLCFSVEFRIDNAEAVVDCDDLVVLSGQEYPGYISVRDLTVECRKHADKEGFVSGRLVLKASRAAALTNSLVKRYYNGEITTRPLRFKITPARLPDGQQRDKADDPTVPPDEAAAANPKNTDSGTVDPNRVGLATDPLQRKVSLSSDGLKLKEALQKVAAEAKLDVEFDAAALKKSGVDLERPVSVNFNGQPLGKALGLLIPWQSHPQVFREVRRGKLVFTTLEAWQKRTAASLPEWMQPHYNHGLLARVDDNDEVATVTTGGIMNDQLLEKLTSLPKLRELHIESTTELTPAGLAHLAGLRSLEKLTLSAVNHEGEGLGDDAIRSLAGSPSLWELSITECGTTDEGAKLLEKVPQLTALSLYQEGFLTDAALASVGKLKNLRSLSLPSYGGTERFGRMKFSADGIRQLAELKELESLQLVGHEVSAAALVFPKLTSLSLENSDVDDVTADRIAQLRELTHLELMYCDITDAGLAQIATLPKLRRLDISSQMITDAGFKAFRKHPQLEHLSLRATRLTDEALEHIAQLPMLARLDLHGSGEPGFAPGVMFTIDGLLQLEALPLLETLWLTNFAIPGGGYAALKELKHLRELTFMMCNVTDAELDALEEALPEASISSATGGGGRISKKIREAGRKAPASVPKREQDVPKDNKPAKP